MRKKKYIRIGISDFEKLRSNNVYYADKTGLIKKLLEKPSEVTLITRPRRFGKTLNMSMLANFFSLDGNKHIFDGLEISKETELCKKYMGKTVSMQTLKPCLNSMGLYKAAMLKP